MTMPTFCIPTPPKQWRLVLLPTTGAKMGDEVVLMPNYAPFGVSVGQLPAGRLKVSISAEKAARMKRGSWSAVLTVGNDNGISAVYRDIVTIGEERETDFADAIKAFAAALPKIELSMLK